MYIPEVRYCSLSTKGIERIALGGLKACGIAYSKLLFGRLQTRKQTEKSADSRPLANPSIGDCPIPLYEQEELIPVLRQPCHPCWDSGPQLGKPDPFWQI